MEVLILSSKKRNEFITIDGLNVSNWESENVYRDLRKGNVNVINATVISIFRPFNKKKVSGFNLG